MRAEYRPGDRSFDITHALKAGQDGRDVARTLTVTGLDKPPRVVLNGAPVEVRAAGDAFQVELAP